MGARCSAQLAPPAGEAKVDNVFAGVLPVDADTRQGAPVAIDALPPHTNPALRQKCISASLAAYPARYPR